jgi:hypothetical protein
MDHERTRLHWIHTAGGPHLVLPAAHASAWEGCFAPTAGRVVEATFRCNPNGPATDYDRACDVRKWLGVIPVGRGQALVLGGDDSQAAYYRSRQGQHYLLRWHYASSETELLDHFHEVWAQLPIEDEATFRHPGGKVFLMEAADIPGRWLIQHGEFVLPRGRYQVLTSHSESEEVYIIIHQLRRCRTSATSPR